MWRLIALVLASVACPGQAVHLQGGGGPRGRAASQGSAGTGAEGRRPGAALHERHLQYVVLNKGGGLRDRLYILTWLLRLGLHYNATTHIMGGRGGARLHLAPKHSKRISPTWDTYFNTSANDGNPFHDVLDLPGCRIVDDPLTDLSTLFDGGTMCVNITVYFHHFPVKYPPGLPAARIPPSRQVLSAAARFRRQVGIPAAYGALHIRRCDMLGDRMRKECTAVDAVYKSVASHDDFSVWFVSVYAEPGYREGLSERLKPLKARFVFDDDKALNPVYPDDNYFTLMVGNEIKGNARVILDSHGCPDRKMPVLHGPTKGQYLMQVSQSEGRAGEGAAEEARTEARELGEYMSGATCEPGR